jgi:PAS domain S-box-containing protein
MNSGKNIPGEAETILESITDGFFSLNLDWEFAYVNRQAERILERARNDLIGKTIWSVYPGLIGSELEALYRHCAREQATGSTTAYYPDHDRWYEAHVYPSRIGISVYFRNATERVRADEKLRESEQRFRLMTDAIPQMVWIADTTGRIVFFNKQWAVYTGESVETMGTQEMSGTFVHPDDEASTAQAWNTARREGQVLNTEQRIRSVSGEYRWFLVRAEPDRNPATGEIVRWFGTSTDVHDRKLVAMTLKAERDQSRHIFDSMSEGFAIMSHDWKMMQINAVGLHVGQRTTEKVIGRSLWDVWPEIIGTEIETRYRRVMTTREPDTFEQYLPFSNGVSLWLELRLLPILDGGMAVHYRDISERKQIEEQLKEADRRKDEFLAMLAHELRNPLAPISAAADLLRIAPSDEKRVKQISEIISRQVTHMTGLVDDLMDVSRVTRGLVLLGKEILDARRVVSDAVEQVRPLIDARRHQLAIHVSPEMAPVLGDQKRLVQAVGNLLSNAAKYTPEGGSIALRMDVRNDQIKIMVADNGIGMTPDLVSRAFELFTQAERTADRTQGGLGIGLALVKSLVGLHQGQVFARSNGLGKGSEFTLCLPRHAMHGIHAERSPVSDSTLQLAPENGLRLLIVDDNADAARMLGMVLEAAGHEVMVEHSSAKALERALIDAPDACLLDIGLPDMDGNELARQLCLLPQTQASTLIAVTGYGQEPERKNAANAGFAYHFVKPVDTAALASLLAQLAESRNAE